MIKYAELPGYRNCGELIPFSHFYQFIQNGADTPVTIVLHAYEGETKAFKGYLFHKKKTFENLPLTTEERKALNHFVGKITQVDLDELLSGSDFEKEISGYQKTGVDE